MDSGGKFKGFEGKKEIIKLNLFRVFTNKLWIMEININNLDRQFYITRNDYRIKQSYWIINYFFAFGFLFNLICLFFFNKRVY